MTKTNDPLSLDRLQRWMQSVITHPLGVAEGIRSEAAQREIAVTPAGVEHVVTRSLSQSSLERLQIYGQAYYARLVECLREEYPAVRAAVGEEIFDAFVMGYLQSYPSQSYTLAKLGAKFPQFLQETHPPAEEAAATRWAEFLVDLATLERTYSEVFDGPGVEGQSLLTPEELRQIPAEDWPEITLRPVPCLRLMTLRFPVQDYVSAVRQGQTPTVPAAEPTYLGVRSAESPSVPAAEPTYLAITRREFIVRRVPLSKVQFELLSALVAGNPLGEALAQTVGEGGIELEALAARLQAWFQEWTAAPFFAGVSRD